jgi:dTDP-L-rhamnose 4-epimerase
MERVLITGGAGFIGSHLADELLGRGYSVRALDELTPQVHGPERRRPTYLDPRVELVVGDVRDKAAVERSLEGVTSVVHLAARVGVGQSMHAVEEYVSVNGVGTAVLLEALRDRPIRRLVVASSMSIYGEGLFRTNQGALVESRGRDLDQLRRGEWELAQGGEPLTPVPTPETKTPSLESVYALSKYDQERLCLVLGRAYRIPTIALRFFNVYGPRQALINPYTGVLAIFAANLLADRPPTLFEDGLQRRDFVSVYDVARACRQALEAHRAPGHVVNVGSGVPRTVREVADRMAAALGKGRVDVEVTERYRMGDVRHCFADITLARHVLEYAPEVSFDAGLRDLARWLGRQVASERIADARTNLEARGSTL